MSIVAVTQGRFENFSGRFGASVGAGTPHWQSEGNKTPSARTARAGAAAESISDAQSAITNASALIAQTTQQLALGSIDDSDALGQYQAAAQMGADAATEIQDLTPGNSAVNQAAAAAVSANQTAQSDTDASAAAGDAAQAIAAASTALTAAQAAAPSPNPAPTGTTTTTTPTTSPTTTTTTTTGGTATTPPTNWTPWIIGGIATVAVGVAGYFGWQYWQDTQRGARRNPVGSKAGAGRRLSSSPSASTIQTLIFPKGEWSAASARSWARSHGFRSSMLDETGSSYRLRQHSPATFKRGTFRTISLGDSGVKAVVARRG